MGTLFITATPIGNLEDITLRALRILKESDAIICENTRVTHKLLSAYGIKKPMLHYTEHASLKTYEHIFSLLREGKSLSFVTDAGTPGISDPGAMLVAKVRIALPSVKIIPIPGASALTAAISLSGVIDPDFLFLGFLPHKKGRETLFKEICRSERTVIFYESPHRILKALSSLHKECGERKVHIARELTKMFEEHMSGTASMLIKEFETHPVKVKGEFVVIVEPA